MKTELQFMKLFGNEWKNADEYKLSSCKNVIMFWTPLEFRLGSFEAMNSTNQQILYKFECLDKSTIGKLPFL